jgi:hypothetical protein
MNDQIADVMAAGNAMQGVQETTDEKQVKTLPFAIQYLKCSEANKDICETPGNLYRGTCWIERNDVRPPTPQSKNMKGQDDKYPGFRDHQIKARTMTMQFLDAMQDAIDTWSEITIVGALEIESFLFVLDKGVVLSNIFCRLANRGSPITR